MKYNHILVYLSNWIDIYIYVRFVRYMIMDSEVKIVANSKKIDLYG